MFRPAASWRTAEIAFAGRGLPIVRTAALRECDYGELTRGPLRDAARYVTERYPGGESYAGVALRVRAFLEGLRSLPNGQVILIIGHRAVHYALEHLLGGADLACAVSAEWRWQPGWRYVL
ncbi:MAG TPA: histidine phosphatase family protein [Bryobacteraceae bacterium]|nr:histidine phosphatase family protein [Bryobacteraceae bacterium]